MANEHDGDHDFKKPLLPERGLHFIQHFAHAATGRICCCIHRDGRAALGLYGDRFGFGWELCEECALIYAEPQPARDRGGADWLAMFHRKTDIDRLIKASKKFRNAHRAVVARMAEGYILCANCETRIQLDKVQVENYLRSGWPKCCVGTLRGGTMQFVGSSTPKRSA